MTKANVVVVVVVVKKPNPVKDERIKGNDCAAPGLRERTNVWWFWFLPEPQIGYQGTRRRERGWQESAEKTQLQLMCAMTRQYNKLTPVHAQG